MEYQNICMGCMGDKGEAEICPHCGYIEGTPPPNGQYLLPRTMLAGKYLVGRGLGHGGFGITYIAFDTVLKRRLAIKEYLPQDCATRGSGQINVTPFSAEEKRQQFLYGVDKFLEEARTLAQFDGHPNIVGVRDFFKENNTAYLVMNYLSGETLKEYLRRHDRALNFQQALKIMLPVIDALRTVHASGVLHRDVSPDNIFLTSNGQVKLIDFGAARQSMGNQRSISVILKPGYAPEEQYRSRGKQGPWTDVYATGATFYRAITGKVPPESLDRMEQDTLAPPSRLGVQIPRVAEEALLKAMAVRAQDRYQSMQEFKDALMQNERPTQTRASKPAAAPIPPRAADAGAQGAPNIQNQNRPAPRIEQERQRPQPERAPMDARSAGRQPVRPRGEGQPSGGRRNAYDPNTYPLKERPRNGLKIGLLVAAIILLLVVGGVLVGLYLLGNWVDNGRPSASATMGQMETSTPPITTTDTPTGDPGFIPFPSPDTTSSLEEISPEPSATPLPENMQVGYASSQTLGNLTPRAGRLLTVEDGNQTYTLLTGEMAYGYVGVAKVSGQTLTDEAYHYYYDAADGVTYGPYAATDEARSKDIIFLPSTLVVGQTWRDGIGGAACEIIAVDYTATLGGQQVHNCIVVKAGDVYHFIAPGIGLHTSRTSFEEDTGVSYRVTGDEATELSLLDMVTLAIYEG